MNHPLFDICEYVYCGKPIFLSQSDIDSGKPMIRIFDESGNQLKGLDGRVGRYLIDGIAHPTPR